MKRLIKLIVAVCVVMIFANPVYAFDDVGENDMNYEAIDYLEREGIVEGYPDGSFGPDRTLNRAELTKIVVESSGYVLVESEDCFFDLEEGSWYARYVCTAFENGVVEGYPDGSFAPGRTINRAEALKIILEAEGLGQSTYTGGYGDVNGVNWFSGYVERGSELNYIPYGNEFEAGKQILRRSFSEIYYRALVSRDETDRVYEVDSSYETIVSDRTYFEKVELRDVDLDTLVPTVVMANEIYFFEGVVRSNEAYLRILNSETGSLRLGNRGDEFMVPVWFGSEGVYELEIGGEVFEVLAMEDFDVDSKVNQYEGDFYTSVEGEEIGLNLEVDSDDALLKRYEFEFVNDDLTLISRQDMDQVRIPKTWLADMWEVEDVVNLNISAASFDLDEQVRSEYEFIGDYGLDVVEDFETIVNNIGDFDLDFTYGAGDRIITTFRPLNDFEEYLYIIRETGEVDILENRIVFNNGTLKFEYTPESGSLYEIVEVNDTDGRALVNYPVYRRNVLPIKPDPYAFSSQDVEVSVESAIDLINQSRLQFGLDEVVVNETLSQLAQSHADDMAINQYVSHEDLDGRKVSDRKRDFSIKTFVGENIARNIQLLDAHNSLMRSAAHRVNILDENWKEAGIGIAYDDNGLLYLVQNFSFNSEIILDDIKNNIEVSLGVEEESDLADVADYWSMRMVEFQDYGSVVGGERLMDRVSELGKYVSGNSVSGISTFIEDVDQLIDENLDALEDGGYEYYGFDVELGDDGVLYFVLIVTS